MIWGQLILTWLSMSCFHMHFTFRVAARVLLWLTAAPGVSRRACYLVAVHYKLHSGTLQPPSPPPDFLQLVSELSSCQTAVSASTTCSGLSLYCGGQNDCAMYKFYERIIIELRVEAQMKRKCVNAAEQHRCKNEDQNDECDLSNLAHSDHGCSDISALCS